MPYPGSTAKELWAMIWYVQIITVVVHANETVPHAITVRNFTIETDERERETLFWERQT